MLASILLAAAAQSPNVLVVILDDVGCDMVAFYDEAPDPPCTPTLDTIATSGLVFRQAWSNPLCSSTRALLLTGRHGFRTGMGKAIVSNDGELSTDETTLPEILPSGYETAYLGKWHLATPSSAALDHATDSGFGSYAGAMWSGVGVAPIDLQNPPFCGLTYNSWVKTTNGVEACKTTYATVDTTDDAIVALDELEEPWMLVVSYNAIHAPYHQASDVTCTPASNGYTMMERLDAELSLLMPYVPGGTYTFLLGDNGTGEQVAAGEFGGCFDPSRSKGTLYQGGVRVPLIVRGPGVPVGEVSSIVSIGDIFATVADLVGSSATADDSVSLLPYLRGSTTPQRSTVYAERFSPNGDPYAASYWRQAIRNERWKLIRRQVDGEVMELEMYDLLADPCETDDLYPPITQAEQDAYAALLDDLP